ncbi:MAG: hypothetical protein WBM54_05115 [Woeseia sp.]
MIPGSRAIHDENGRQTPTVKHPVPPLPNQSGARETAGQTQAIIQHHKDHLASDLAAKRVWEYEGGTVKGLTT